MSKKIVLFMLAVAMALAGCTKMVLKPEEQAQYNKAVAAIESARADIKEAEKLSIPKNSTDLFNTAKEKVVTAQSLLDAGNYEKAVWFAEQSKEHTKKVRESIKK